MPSKRLKLVGAVVIAMGALQILFEDILMFFALTGTGPSAIVNSPYVLVGIPLAISVTLLGVLVGGALLSSEPFR